MSTVPTAPSTTTLRVRYAETDRMGVVYYANYLVWFEVARADWLRERGFNYREMEAGGVLLPVISAHCDYQRSAHYDEAITIRATGVLHSKVRVEFTYDVFKEDGTLAARGTTMHAAVDPQGRPCRLPEQVREVFQ
ncbi:MAG: acyl-CoA thioesterase [Acidobacteria bacterium]|jgi:acyl-CoA thioester hydrolase|nr:acyl-CoA thioesterase [Acidobacteriota bacterium]